VADGANRFTGLKLDLSIPHLSSVVKGSNVTIFMWQNLELLETDKSQNPG
jgi:hypothetical protein